MTNDTEISDSKSHRRNSKQIKVDDSDDVSQSSENSLDHDAANPTPESLGERETRALFWSRILVGVTLLCVAGAAGVTTFIITTRSQEKVFLSQFETLAETIVVSLEDSIANVADLLATKCSTMTTFAISQQAPWPFYTYPDYEVLGSRFRHDSGAHYVSWTPIIQGEEQLALWNSYSEQNMEWLQDAVTWNEQVEGISKPTDLQLAPEGIFYQSPLGTGRIAESGKGPFAPEWQMSGLSVDASYVNYNLMKNEAFTATATYATEQGHSVVSPLLDRNSEIRTLNYEYREPVSPRSLVVAPIFDEFINGQGRNVVGIAIAEFSWQNLLGDILHFDSSEVVVVLSDGEYGHEFTFKIEGEDAYYLGEGDIHDRHSEEYAIVHDKFACNASPGHGYEVECQYSLKIYPTPQLYKDFQSSAPIIWTTAVVLILALISAVFFVYDFAVQRRQKAVMTSAAKSNALVSSLFPAEIRDRLFSSEKEKNGNQNIFPHLPESSKFRLKNYLAEEQTPVTTDEGSTSGEQEDDKNYKTKARKKEGGKQGGSDTPSNVDLYETKPIADLFPKTTVMFADIAGFTAWSSVREPSQVFTLLETVYRAFDSIAKRRRVFKVETVGDCYVAVTGLPEPRKDHAIVMARFARECLEKFNELAKQLEITLGPDTGDLAIRVGLHSGPVTAGVLRGDKSRFQLFGDTVNTAARVESTGQRNRIHLSSDTAEQLIGAGKSHWVTKRQEKVVAKGKGEMQTYWLQKSDDGETDQASGEEPKGAAQPALHSAPKLGDATIEQLEKSLPPKVQRLVSWNVEILKKLLQQIVAQRNARPFRRNNDQQLTKMEKEIGKGVGVLDEVVESIALPKFDHKAHKNQENPNKIEINEKVMEQLRLFVSTVAAIHRGNPFHNFEHASHVTMSVNKLLSRIVAPDEVINSDESAQDNGKNYALDLHDHTYGITSDPLTQFSVVLAALIHDVDHFGVSNFQLIKENHKLAHIFRNKSVAEQNSIILAWEKLMQPRFAELRRCIYSDPSELQRFRQLVVNSVLATDIFDKELQSLRKSRWEKAFHSKYHIAATADDVNRKATVVIEHLIQASDVAHTMQHWHIYQKWNERLFQEMTDAHKNGRMENNPATGWYQGELGFFDNYVIPLAKKLKECGVFGVASDEYLNYALENRREWHTKGEEVVASMIVKYQRTTQEESLAEKTPLSTMMLIPTTPTYENSISLEEKDDSSTHPLQQAGHVLLSSMNNEDGVFQEKRLSQANPQNGTPPLSENSSESSR